MLSVFSSVSGLGPAGGFSNPFPQIKSQGLSLSVGLLGAWPANFLHRGLVVLESWLRRKATRIREWFFY